MASIRTVWKRLLGVERVVVEDWYFQEVEGLFVVHVRPTKRERGRCSICRRRCGGYDAGAGPRRWRALDLGTVQAYLEADMPRVSCAEHGVVVQAVPWARPHSGFTRDFEDQCAWLAVHTNRSAVSDLLRVAWRTVSRIVRSVGDEARSRVDLLAGLHRIGIDELSHRKGHKYVAIAWGHSNAGWVRYDYIRWLY